MFGGCFWAVFVQGKGTRPHFSLYDVTFLVCPLLLLGHLIIVPKYKYKHYLQLWFVWFRFTRQSDCVPQTSGPSQIWRTNRSVSTNSSLKVEIDLLYAY